MDVAGRDLVDAVAAALPGWVERSIDGVLAATGVRPPDGAAAAVAELAAGVTEAVVSALRSLVAADIDEQASTPLSILRAAAAGPTALLASWGVPPVAREAWRAERFPDDVYDLSPAAFSDFGPEVHEAGIRWAAAKALAHRRRHGP